MRRSPQLACRNRAAEKLGPGDRIHRQDFTGCYPIIQYAGFRRVSRQRTDEETGIQVNHWPPAELPRRIARASRAHASKSTPCADSDARSSRSACNLSAGVKVSAGGSAGSRAAIRIARRKASAGVVCQRCAKAASVAAVSASSAQLRFVLSAFIHALYGHTDLTVKVSAYPPGPFLPAVPPVPGHRFPNLVSYAVTQPASVYCPKHQVHSAAGRLVLPGPGRLLPLGENFHRRGNSGRIATRRSRAIPRAIPGAPPS